MRIGMVGYRDWARDCRDYVKDVLAASDVRWYEQLTLPPRDDVTFLIGWSEMVSDDILSAMPPGSLLLAVHPSPLPQYRGGSPLQHQIIDGLTSSAASIFRIDLDHPGVDSGPLCWQGGLDLSGSLPEVLQRLSRIAADGIIYCVRALSDERLSFWEQGEAPDGPRRRRHPSESEITIDEIRKWTARQLHDKVRALQGPYPRAFITAADGERLYIDDTSLTDGGAE